MAIINFAVIGTGIMGRNHARVLKSLPGTQLAAVCDPASVESFGVPAYPNLESMLKKHRIEAAVIATPTTTHAEIARACANHGIHLLIEKPIAQSPAEATVIQSIAAGNKIRVAIGHVERFNPAVQSLRNELKGKKILSVTALRIGHIPPRIADTGVLLDLAVHDIDLITFVTGKKIARSTIFASRKLGGRVEDNAVLSFRLEDDTVASITTNWLSPFKKRRLEIAAEDAYYEADLITRQVNAYSAYEDNGSFITRACRVLQAEPLVQELSAFVQFIQTGNPGDLATVADGIAAMAVATSPHA
jgi:UDP-N-acetylglucosamine 3-dehydrogenase